MRLVHNNHAGIRGYRHVACAIVGKTRWWGANSRKTHPESLRKDKGVWLSALHAEQDALLKVPERIRHEARLYVARVRADGSFSMSKPCEMCQASIDKWAVTTVYYTNQAGEWEQL